VEDALVKMVDKRLWPVVYAAILAAVLVAVWQISGERDPAVAVTVYSLYSSNASYSHPVGSLPPDDYPQLIDLRNFTFTMLSLPCNDSSPVLLVLVHSDPKNFDTRRVVRETWGRNTAQVRVLFVTGLVRGAVKSRLEREHDEFGDVIQGSFDDAYRNMTYKHVMVFKYAIYHCPQARYVLKTDDDVFVNMPSMIRFLTADLSPFGGSRMLFCTLRTGSMVVRSWRSKWRVSFKEYPAKTYPPYCPGWAILYSPDVVFDLYREAQKSDYFWIDDVHITGTLADRVRLAHVNVDNLVLTDRQMSYAVDQPSRFNRSFLYGAPNINNHQIKALWEYAKNQDSHVSLLGAIS
jgi:hypothetical protein